MSRSVVLEERATDAPAGFLRDDADGVRAVLDGVDALARSPEPAASSRLGADRRLRVGRYRVYYRFDDETVTVQRVGRVVSG